MHACNLYSMAVLVYSAASRQRRQDTIRMHGHSYLALHCVQAIGVLPKRMFRRVCTRICTHIRVRAHIRVHTHSRAHAMCQWKHRSDYTDRHQQINLYAHTHRCDIAAHDAVGDTTLAVIKSPCIASKRNSPANSWVTACARRSESLSAWSSPCASQTS